MLSRSATIRAVAEALEAKPDIPIVLDPVMVATSGDLLLRSSAIAALKSILLPRATIITPNLHEAAALTGLPLAKNEQEMEQQARQLHQAGVKAVLIKGGHGAGAESVDLLVTTAGLSRYATPRIDTPNVHGTGCTLSSAIAAGLAKGFSLEAACGEAKTYITSAIAASYRINIGHGHGPAHHFHQFW
jgi:hydroxymethylpyrimidine/phosphomethylpyrimidine kinase